MSLLDVKDLSISFGERRVVDRVSFQIQSGEKLALVGESGSGKTVTALSTLRLVEGASLEGQIRFEERDVLHMKPGELEALRGGEIAVIFQEPMTALNPVMTVGNQIEEALQVHRGLVGGPARAQATAALRRVGVSEPERRLDSFPHQLSGGQRQRVMIAMALACEPKLLIADEPTTALDASIRHQILDLIDGLRRERGLAVLVITHDLNLVRRFADRVAVMERGRLVEQGRAEEVLRAPRHPYTRKLLDSRPEREVGEPGQGAVMVGREVQVQYPVPRPGVRGWFSRGTFTAVHGASFTLAPGETLGVIGESGSGKTSLGMALLDLTASTGTIEIGGQSWAALRGGAKRELRRQMQVVFQDPFSSLSPRQTIERIVGEGLSIHEPGLPPSERRQRVMRALEEVGLGEDEQLLDRYPHEFSGGQRQRIAVARALIVRPRVMVLDEPTSSLDVTIQKQVLQLLTRLQRQHALSYVLITHDIEVVRALAHRVMVMKDGQVVEAGPVDEVLTRPASAYTRELMSA